MNNKYSNLQALQGELARFREHWPDAWPGLPVIVSECLSELGHRAGAPLEPRLQAIYDCLAATAVAVEGNGLERDTQGTEPAYHNRLHIADTLATLVCLLLHSRADRPSPAGLPIRQEWLLLLAMLAHDYLHTGKVNQFPAELEQAAVAGLRPLMAECGMAPEDQALVADLILMTDPTRVGKTHESVGGKPFCLNEFNAMAVLLQESDILASVLPGIGLEQTRRLSDEWAKFSDAMASNLLRTAARVTFLRDYARFSSPASQRLGIPALVEQQLAALAGREPSAPI